jgi:hypothetical protein
VNLVHRSLTVKFKKNHPVHYEGRYKFRNKALRGITRQIQESEKERWNSVSYQVIENCLGIFCENNRTIDDFPHNEFTLKPLIPLDSASARHF